MKKRGRDNPEGLTARQVIEDIAAFPLRKEFEIDPHGEIKNGSCSWSDGYAAFRNQQFAQQWLDYQTRRKRR